jgi:UDP-glucose 4-epimerase
MSLQGKSVLVTGGAGFIGSHLVDRIIKERPADISVIDNMSLGNQDNLSNALGAFDIDIFKTDISNKKNLQRIIEKKDVDVVFNLAVVPLPVSFTDPRRCLTENIDGVINICEMARKGKFDTLIHFSSSEVYGDCIKAPMDEEHPLNGKTPYAASKISGDKIIKSYITTYSIDSTIIRPFNNFGPRQNYQDHAGVIPITVRRILEGSQPVIYGDGSQTRDFIYVEDTVDAAVELYMESKSRGQVVNIGSGVERTIESLLNLVTDYMDYTGEIMYKEERTADVERHLADISRANKLINFEPSRNFENNLSQTVDWFVQEMKS